MGLYQSLYVTCNMYIGHMQGHFTHTIPLFTPCDPKDASSSHIGQIIAV